MPEGAKERKMVGAAMHSWRVLLPWWKWGEIKNYSNREPESVEIQQIQSLYRTFQCSYSRFEWVRPPFKWLMRTFQCGQHAVRHTWFAVRHERFVVRHIQVCFQWRPGVKELPNPGTVSISAICWMYSYPYFSLLFSPLDYIPPFPLFSYPLSVYPYQCYVISCQYNNT